MEISKRGCGPTTNQILNDAEHQAGVLPAQERAKTAGLQPTGLEILAQRNAKEMDLHHRLQEMLDEDTAKTVVHIVAPRLTSLVSPLMLAKTMVEETHADWKAGQAAKQAMVNDVADLSVSTLLDYSSSFKSAEFNRRQHVANAAEKTRTQLETQKGNKALLQARSDQGFLAAARAARALQHLPLEQRRDAILATLQRSNGGALGSDLAYAKGVEYYLHCQADPGLLSAETSRIGARNFTPPVQCRG